MQSETNTFPCVNCGAQLAFKPGANHLSCDRCGTEQPIPETDGSIEEYSLQDALKGAERIDPSSLSEDASEVRCSGCGAIALVTGTADRCAFCDSPVIVFNDDSTILRPESVLPFKIEQRTAGASFRTWINSRWFAPNDLKHRAQQEAIDGVYLPYWTFDAEATGVYAGERGDHYEEEEDTEDAEGNPTTRTVRKTDWSDVEGQVQRSFDDVLVCATNSLPRGLTQALEPWDLSSLRPFEPSYLAGFQAERYGVELEEGWEVAQQRIEHKLRSDVRDDIGGDEQKIRSLKVHHNDVTFKHTLLPLWISSYRYNGDVYRVIVNARTGAITGDRPYSKLKITLTITAFLLLIVFFCGGFSCCTGTAGLTSGS